MCGLTGIFFRDESHPVDGALLRRMNGAIGYRGPDGDGFHIEPGIGLGHRRLAIIDVAGGHQPMFNEDGSVVIVFNGEIYRHAALRAELEALGHVFTTRSDTETIIHAWESWGPDCLSRLSGMFALALWDRARQCLFLARDRLGKKPLHYATAPDGSLVFGSELAALAPVPGVLGTYDPLAIDDYFTFGYVPDPRTIYRGVHKLPAAHYLLVERGAPLPQPQRYWTLPATEQQIDAPTAIRELTQRLKDCTAARLVADVPLGAFLSGGVDSSAVVATAAQLSADPLKTFTIAFAGAEDETPYANRMAERYGTDQRAEAASADMIEAARVQGRMFGEPFGDQSSVPTHSVCALARRHVTVAISGDGGDEVFAGYRRHQWHRMTEAVRAYIPAPVRRRVLGQLAAVYPKLDWAPRWLRAKHTLTELSLDSALGYVRMLTKVHHQQRRALFSARLEAQLDGYDPGRQVADLFESFGSDDSLRQAQFVDITTYLVGDINTKVDRASMAASLEVRAPFLDYELVEWGLALPAGLKLHGAEGKWVLKRAMEPFVPHDILYRQKQGFATSLRTVFRAGAGRLRERLLGAPMLDSGLFEPATLGQLIDEHEQGRFDHSGVLWLLLVFEGFLAHVAAQLPAPSRELAAA